jgi:phage pi2 protein 07
LKNTIIQSPIKIKSQEDKIVLTKKELEELIKKEKDKNKKNDLEVLKVNKDIKDISGFDE